MQTFNLHWQGDTLTATSISALDELNPCSSFPERIPTRQFTGRMEILPPQLSGFTDYLPISIYNITSSRDSFEYHLINNIPSVGHEDIAENTFIIIPNPGIFSDIRIDTLPFTLVRFVVTAGDTTDAFFYQAGDIALNVNKSHQIVFTVDSCASSDTIPIYYGWNCGGYPSGNIFTQDSFCFINSDNSITLNFENPIVSLRLDTLKTVYSLCQPEIFETTLSVTQAGIHNIELDILFNAPELRLLNQNNFDTSAIQVIYHQGSISYPLQFSIMNLSIPDTGYRIIVNNASLPAGNLQAGDFISFAFTYVPRTIYSSSPFTLRSSFSNYCDNNSILSDSLRLNQWTFTGIDDCNQNFTVEISASTQAPCSGGSFQLYSQITGPATGVPPYTYTWTSTPPLTIAQVQNPVISGLHANTTFVVTITDSLGKTGTDTIVINLNTNQCCTPAGFNPVMDYDFSRRTASSLINDPIHPVMQPFTTGQLILINDTFTVDVDFNFTSCQHIILGPGAVIDVLPGASLSLFYSTIVSCNEMARGIIAQSGSIVSVKNAFIHDCQYGIEARDNSTVFSEESYFTNDYVGIYYSPVGAHSQTIHVFGEVVSTEFSSTSSLKNEFRGQFPTPLTKPFAGVLMEKLASINFGNFNKPANRFYDLNFGIHATSSNLNVRNCYFRRIKDYDTYQSFYRTRGSGIFTDGRQGVHQLHQYGSNDSQSPEFIDCFTGIYSLASGVSSWNNYMENCDEGYRLFGGRNLTFRIERNHIDFNDCGIASVFNNASIIKEINENVLTGGKQLYRLRGATPTISHPYGIIIADGSTYNYGGSIRRNIIDIDPHQGASSMGISLTGAGTYKVLDNFIILENDNPVNAIGISIQNSRYNNIECNKIFGTNTNQIYLERDIAMHFSKSPSNFISCNEAENTSIGYQFSDNCLDGANNPTIFRTNDFGLNHYRGLYYSASARVDRQPFRGNSWFQNPYPEFGARNDNPVSVANDKYDVEQGGINNLPVPVTAGWFNPPSLSGQDENCDLLSVHHGLCYSVQNPPPVPSNYLELIRIARDSAQSIEYDEEARWKAKVELYEKLMQTPQYMDSSIELADFYLACAGTVIQKIASLHIETNELYSNTETLVQIMQTNALEVYQKSEILRQYDELLRSGISTQEYDSIKNLRNTIVFSIKQLVNYNTEALHLLDSSLTNRVDILNAENQSINSSEIIEQNERTINDAYYNSIAGNKIENIFNYAAPVLNVAMQCPLSGGSSVYRARALYYVIDPDMTYEDELTCLQSGYLYKTSKNIRQKSKLYPNPTSNEINLIYNVSENANLEITDNWGRLFQTQSLSKDLINISFSVSGLENGIYYYRIIGTGNNLIDVGQFIVIR